jgi:hypothetical protein
MRPALLALAASVALALPLAAQQPSAAPVPPPAQPAFSVDSAAVVTVVRTIFNGMRTRDTALMRAQFHFSATLRSANYDRTGKAVISEDGVNDWISGVGGAPPAMVIDERLGTPVVQVDGNLASVWVYYELYVSDRFSHCGADQFTLGRTPDGWKIIGVADSRRRGPSCAQNLPKGS